MGFQLLTLEDPTRSFPSDEPDALRIRAVLVHIWYPIARATGQTMKVGDFVRMAADDFRLRTKIGPDTREKVDLPVLIAKGFDKSQIQTLLASPTKAILLIFTYVIFTSPIHSLVL